MSYYYPSSLLFISWLCAFLKAKNREMFWCPLLIMPHLSLGTHLIKMCIIQSPNKLTFIFAIWTTKLVIPLVLCSQTLLNKTITIKGTVKNILKQKLALFWTFFVIHFLKVRTSKTPSNKRIFNEWLFLCLCLRKRKPAKAEELSSFYLSLKCVFPTYIFINKIFFNITSACNVSRSYVFWILL